MTPQIPHVMKAVRLVAYGRPPTLEVREVPVPRPTPGQVLVRLTRAPLLPIDVAFCEGAHGDRKPLPVTPGLEGAGAVVASGGGMYGRWLVGRRVAVVPGPQGDGTWAEYVAVDATACLPVWSGLSDEAAATLSIYPVAALALLDTLRGAGHRAAVHTGSRDLLDRLVTRLAAVEGYPLVHVVADTEQADALGRLGADTVVIRDAPDFDARLRRACREHRTTALLDAVGGGITARVLEAMPDGAEGIVYDARTEEPVRLDTWNLVHRGQSVRGFPVLDHARRGEGSLLRRVPQLRRYATGPLSVARGAEISLADVPGQVPRLPRDTTATLLL